MTATGRLLDIATDRLRQDQRNAVSVTTKSVAIGTSDEATSVGTLRVCSGLWEAILRTDD